MTGFVIFALGIFTGVAACFVALAATQRGFRE
jgi:hypothetical protein